MLEELLYCTTVRYDSAERSDLEALQRRGLVSCTSLNRAVLAWLTPDGVKYAKALSLGTSGPSGELSAGGQFALDQLKRGTCLLGPSTDKDILRLKALGYANFTVHTKSSVLAWITQKGTDYLAKRAQRSVSPVDKKDGGSGRNQERDCSSRADEGGRAQVEIAGRITVHDGDVLPRVRINVSPQDGQRTATDITADSSGLFSAAGLLPGRYTLTAYPYRTGNQRVSRQRFARQRLYDVQAGQSNVAIQLHLAASIHGVVSDADGKPTQYVSVAVLDKRGKSLIATSTDKDGRFRLMVAHNDVVTLRAEAHGGSRAEPARLLGVRPSGSPVTLQIPGPKQ